MHVMFGKKSQLSFHPTMFFKIFPNEATEQGYRALLIYWQRSCMHLCHQPIRPGDGYYIAFILSIPKLPMRSECSFIKRPANGRPCSPAGYNSVLTRKHTSIRNKLIWVLVHIKGQLYVKVQLRLLFSN